MTFDGAVVREDNGSRHALYGPRVTYAGVAAGASAAAACRKVIPFRSERSKGPGGPPGCEENRADRGVN